MHRAPPNVAVLGMRPDKPGLHSCGLHGCCRSPAHVIPLECGDAVRTHARWFIPSQSSNVDSFVGTIAVVVA